MSVEANKPSLFPTLTTVLFPLITDCLSQHEIRQLERTCRGAKFRVTFAKTLTKQLHLSKVQADETTLPLQLHGAFVQHPRLTGLDLNITDIKSPGIRLLGNSPLIARLVQISLYGRTSRPIEQDDLTLLVEKINFVQLEVFNIGQALTLPQIPDALLREKLQSCQNLKSLQLTTSNLSNSYERLLLEILPDTLQEFGPLVTYGKYSALTLTDEFIDQLMSKFKNPQAIRKCNLEVKRVSPAKLRQLLTFLPLQAMTHITFFGKAMTGENLNYISSQLEKNSALIQCSIASPESEVGIDAIQTLISSLNSEKLTSFSVVGYQSEEALRGEKVKKTLLHKLPSLPNLSSLFLGGLQLDLMRAQLPH